MPATPPRPGPADTAASPRREGDTPSRVENTALTEVVLPTGAKLGKYAVKKVLGRGGMGCVYLAYDPTLRRSVAVKVMHPELAAQPEFRERFLREARAVAALAHDNVIGIFEVAEAGGTVFFAMPHLSGSSLGKYLATRGVPPLPAAVRIAREVASGLAAAHAVGLLHRDVKPGNIFLESPKGRAKLLDFGLVTPTTGESRLTEIGLVVGTPAYMSPEQARGWPLDARSDLFSVGAVLYHLCGGRMPFVGHDSMAVLAALVSHPPTPVRQLNPQVPDRLSHLIDRLLCKNPEGRPASAGELVAELKGIERELIGGGTNAVVVPGAVADATTPPPPLDAEAVDVPEEPPLEVDEPVPPTPGGRPVTRKRRRSRPRAADRARTWWVWMPVATAAVILFAGIGLVVVLAAQNAPKSSTPPTTPAAAKPTEPAEVRSRPWWDGKQWVWYTTDGQTKPMPAGWRPGQRIPAEFRDPGPPPPGGPQPGDGPK